MLLLFLPECLFDLGLDQLVLLALTLLLLKRLQPLEQPPHLLHRPLALIPRLLVQLQRLHKLNLERSDLVRIANLILLKLFYFQLQLRVLQTILGVGGRRLSGGMLVLDFVVLSFGISGTFFVFFNRGNKHSVLFLDLMNLFFQSI